MTAVVGLGRDRRRESARCGALGPSVRGLVVCDRTASACRGEMCRGGLIGGVWRGPGHLVQSEGCEDGGGSEAGAAGAGSR